MKRSLSHHASVSFLACVLFCSAPSLLSQDKPKSAAAAASSLAEEFQALVSEYNQVQKQFMTAYQAAKSDDERRKLKYPNPEEAAPRFLSLAEKKPNDPAALDAVIWVAQNTRSGPAFEKALRIVRENHLQSERLASFCDLLGFTASKEAREILSDILEKNSHREVQGHACLSLALASKENDFAAAEKQFNQVIEKYSDLKHSFGRATLGDMAKAELFERQNLAVGRAAPDVEGEDVDSKKFKLSDYRGKVVLIDFWGDW